MNREYSDFIATVLLNKDNPTTLEFLVEELVTQKEVIIHLGSLERQATLAKARAS